MPYADMTAREGRICANSKCRQPIPLTFRLNTKFCSKECRRKNPEMRKYQCDINRKRLYGITADEFDSLLASQRGCCAICKSGTPGGKGNWHVDHNHSSGVIRGLLCHSCNVFLGNAKDDPEILKSAIKYLEGK